MKLIDEIFEMYRHHLTGDEEDADIITFSILESLNRKDLLELIGEMDDDELFSMVGLYMLELLKNKLGQINEVEKPENAGDKGFLH